MQVHRTRLYRHELINPEGGHFFSLFIICQRIINVPAATAGMEVVADELGFARRVHIEIAGRTFIEIDVKETNANLPFRGMDRAGRRMVEDKARTFCARILNPADPAIGI